MLRLCKQVDVLLLKVRYCAEYNFAAILATYKIIVFLMHKIFCNFIITTAKEAYLEQTVLHYHAQTYRTIFLGGLWFGYSVLIFQTKHQNWS